MDTLVRGVRIAYDDEGSGPLAVRLHGLGGSRANEDATGSFDVAALRRAGRLVRYDARGHGRSGGAAVEGDYAVPNLARDLLALLDALQVDGPVSGVGGSMGTATLLHAVTAAPERFARLVLTCPPTAWETRAAQREIYRDGARFVEDQGKAAFEAAMAELPRPPVLAALPRLPVDISEALLPAVLRGVGGSDLPTPEAIAAIRLPTLVLAWADDPGHPVSTAERLCALIPGAELDVARTPEALATWGERAARFLDS